MNSSFSKHRIDPFLISCDFSGHLAFSSYLKCLRIFIQIGHYKPININITWSIWYIQLLRQPPSQHLHIRINTFLISSHNKNLMYLFAVENVFWMKINILYLVYAIKVNETIWVHDKTISIFVTDILYRPSQSYEYWRNNRYNWVSDNLKLKFEIV